MTEPVQGFIRTATDDWLTTEQEELANLLAMAVEDGFATDGNPYMLHEDRLVAITRELRARGCSPGGADPTGLRDDELPETTQRLLQEEK